ncbi:LytR family transcriptional regulator [Micromonospora zingiberis]|uniref:LytR family transcriptional regulator n=1 Tax=Micromonospora zingiberis TaxID=2053011 RepID=A0A4R0G9U9_9ACTN|nr:LCP family protein [Micromonospora zingiberis]TCB92762.1 LytR family transcriptional regulator [Micromonospora zingiberis]
MLLAAVALVGLRVLADRYERTVTREQLLDPSARAKRTDLDGPLNYLLVGSDRRPGDVGPEQRTDTILIVHIPAGLREGYLVSVPRDLLVTIPPGAGWPGGEDKINTAFEYGGGGQSGAQLLSATLTRLTGIRFDGAALVDFAGLRSVIDLLDGVEMCVRTEVRSIHTKRVFPPGCQRMDGAAALDYVRQRYDLPGGDYDRQTHQQQLLGAMLERAGETRVRNNPVQLHRLIEAVGESLTVDTNGVPVEDLLLALHGLSTDGLRGVQVPSYPQTIDQVSYVLLDNGGEGLFEAVRGTRMPQWAGAHPRWVTRL